MMVVNGAGGDDAGDEDGAEDGKQSWNVSHEKLGRFIFNICLISYFLYYISHIKDDVVWAFWLVRKVEKFYVLYISSIMFLILYFS